MFSIFFALLSLTSQAADVTYDGFVDTYYAYDFNAPANFDRAYTTQPARSDEFNINLVSLGATLTRAEIRGRLALQAGTSVQANYAGEPSNGSVSGGLLSRHIQEAYLGTRINEKLWLDGGIYFSHVGGEGFISKNNLAYTKSLVADYSPYYQAGVRLSYAISPEWSAQLHVVNGWQTISETNHSKMIGTQVSYAPSSKFSLVYNTLLGREQQFRQFHDLVFNFKPNESWSALAQFDFGKQGASEWSGWTAIGKFQFDAKHAVVARVEAYRDPDQVLVVTSSPHGFQTRSASIGYDETLDGAVLWRTEYRIFLSDEDAVFPSSEGPQTRDSLVVTSLSASF